MDYVLLLAVLYLMSAAQMAVAPALTVGDATPNLLAAAAAVWMTLFRDERALVSAALWGLAVDLQSGGRLGVSAAAYLLAAFALLRARPPAPLPGWLMMAAAGLLVLVITLAESVARAVRAGSALSSEFWQRWWECGIYSAILAAGLMFLSRSSVAIFGPDEPGAWSAEA